MSLTTTFRCLTFFLAISLLPLFALQAQEHQLLVAKFDDGKVIHLKKGYRVFVQTTDAEKEVRGVLMQVGTESIQVNQKVIPLNSIVAINGVSRTQWIAVAGGFVLAGVGAVWNTFGLLFYAQGITDGDPLFIAGGIIDMGIGGTIGYFGLKPFYKRKRRYREEKGWEIISLPPSETGPLESFRVP